jgi:hypothetical protein
MYFDIDTHTHTHTLTRPNLNDELIHNLLPLVKSSSCGNSLCSFIFLDISSFHVFNKIQLYHVPKYVIYFISVLVAVVVRPVYPPINPLVVVRQNPRSNNNESGLAPYSRLYREQSCISAPDHLFKERLSEETGDVRHILFKKTSLDTSYGMCRIPFQNTTSPTCGFPANTLANQLRLYKTAKTCEPPPYPTGAIIGVRVLAQARDIRRLNPRPHLQIILIRPVVGHNRDTTRSYNSFSYR